jgi:hypothetical protein
VTPSARAGQGGRSDDPPIRPDDAAAPIGLDRGGLLSRRNAFKVLGAGAAAGAGLALGTTTIEASVAAATGLLGIFPVPAATGNSTTDTASLLETMAAAAAAGGGIVLVPPGTYSVAASLVFTADNIWLVGSGWGTVLEPVSKAQFDLISTPIPSVAGTPGYVRNFIGISNLAINCGRMAGTQAGSGNALHTYGLRYSVIDRLYIVGAPNWAVLLDGDDINFGYDNVISRCLFNDNAANLYCTYCEANDLTDNRFCWCGTATAAPQTATGMTMAQHLGLNSGYNYVAGNVFGRGGTYTTPAVTTTNNGPCRIIGNRFDQVRYQAVVLNAGNHCFIANQVGSVASAGTGVPGVQIESSNNRVTGNVFDDTAGPIVYSYAIAEAGGPFSGNVIADNNLLRGTQGVVSLNPASTDQVANNPGYNPVGVLAPPAFPRSGLPVTNCFGVAVSVAVTAGTGSVALDIGGAPFLTVAAGSTAVIRLPPGQSVAAIYTAGTPRWVWIGD